MRGLLFVSACFFFLLADMAFSNNITVNISSVEGVYTYTVGNRTDSPILIYYNTNVTIPLSNIKCNTSTNTYYNPVTVYAVYLKEGRGNVMLTCYNQNTLLHTIDLDIQDSATVTISNVGMTAAMYTNTYSYYPDGPDVKIPVLSYPISLTLNVSNVRWRSQSNATYTDNPYTLGQLMTLNYTDTYYAERIEGKETTRAVEVKLVAVGTAIAILSSFTDAVLLYNNSIIEPITTGGLICVTSSTATDTTQWYYQTGINETRMISGQFNLANYGFYYSQVSSMPGYHTCEVLNEQQNTITYVIGIFRPDNFALYNFEQLPPTTYYTVGTDLDNISYIYVNIPTDRHLSGIRYTTDTGSEQYYYNPVMVHDVYTRVGRGSFVLTCYYQTLSPHIDILHTVSIVIRDSANISITDSYATRLYGDTVNNTVQLAPYSHTIPVLTQNITISLTSTCYTGSVCAWTIYYSNGSIVELSDTVLHIPVITVQENARYVFTRSIAPGANRTGIVLNITATDSSIATLTDSTYTTITNDSLLLQNTTVACASALTGIADISWEYKPAVIGSTWEQYTCIHEITSISQALTHTLIATDKMGAYRCVFANSTDATVEFFIVNLVDGSIPTINISSVEGVYTYTVGNRTDSPILIYYNTDPSVSLSDIKCESSTATYNNPITVYDVYLKEGRGKVELICKIHNTILHTIELDIQDSAAVTISYGGKTAAVYTNTFSYYPNGPVFRIPVLSYPIILSCNVSTVRWNSPDNTEANPYTFDEVMTLNNADTYYAERIEGKNTTRAVEVTLVAVGTAIASISSYSDAVLLYNNSIIEPITTGRSLFCVTSSNAAEPAQWYYQTVFNETRMRPNQSKSEKHGLYYSQYSHMSGYHTCEVLGEQNNTIIYVIGLFRPDNITLYNFEQLPATTYYIVGNDISYIYVNIASDRNLSQIRYTTDAGSEQYYYNPVMVHDVYTRVGRGSFVLTCYYQTLSSYLVILHTANITILDSATISITDSYATHLYGDTVNNTVQLTPYTHTIPVLAQNITISLTSTCYTGSVCAWTIYYSNGSIVELSDTVLHIPVMTVQENARYVFTRNIAPGDNRTGIVLDITATDSSIATLSDSTYTTITNDSLLLQNTTVACASALTGIADISWEYKPAGTGNTWEQYTSMRDITSISQALTQTLITTDKMGAYRCVLVDSTDATVVFFIVSLVDFNNLNILQTDLSNLTHYNYLIGVDPQLSIFYNNASLILPASSIKWHVASGGDGKFSDNPISLYSVYEVVGRIENLSLTCYSLAHNTFPLGKATLTIRDSAVLTVTYNDEVYQYTDINNTVFPSVQTLYIPVYTADITLSCSTSQCYWYRNNSQFLDTSSTITIQLMDISHNGVYSYSRTNNTKLAAADINIIATGAYFGTIDPTTQASTSITGYIVYDANQTLLCASDNSYSITWLYDSTNDITNNANLSVRGTVSVLYTSKPGYYTCSVVLANATTALSDRVLIIDRTDTLTTQDSNIYRYTYTRGVDASANLLCSNYTEWSIDIDGHTIQIPNPLNLDLLQLNYSSNSYTNVSGICGDVTYSFILQGSPSVMISVGLETYNLSSSVTPPQLSVAALSSITLRCSVSQCVYARVQDIQDSRAKRDITDMSSREHVINRLNLDTQGVYSYSIDNYMGSVTEAMRFMLIANGTYYQKIVSLNVTKLNQSSIHLSWFTEYPLDANETFNVSYKLITSDTLLLSGTTAGLNYTISNLTSDKEYDIEIILANLMSSNVSINTTSFYLMRDAVASDETIGIIAVVVGFLIVLLLALILVLLLVGVLLMLYYKKRSNKGYKQEIDVTPSAKQPSSQKTTQSRGGYGQIGLGENIVLSELKTNINSSNELLEDPEAIDSGEKGLYENADSALLGYRARPIELGKYDQHVTHLWEDNEAICQEEYISLGGEALRYQTDRAYMNKMKNRYRFIYPYDKSRVALKGGSEKHNTDYVNASYMPGVYVLDRFIAAQGPKDCTLIDFWTMIWENNVRNVVMVTNFMEGDKNKCEPYWKDTIGDTVKFNKIAVTLTSKQINPVYLIREFNVQLSGRSLQVRHFHYLAWPDHGVPTVFDDLLKFINIFKNSKIEDSSPILVHCSAGVGRTGTFITLYNLIEIINNKEPFSVYHVVNQLREHRPQMVQTYRQYRFIYLAVLEILIGGDTAVPVNEFIKTYREFMKTDTDKYVSVFLEQFNELRFQSEKSFNFEMNEGKKNPHKNNNSDFLPYDDNRVRIHSPYNSREIYINASYMNYNKSIMVTQLASNDTIQDFLEMVYQYKSPLVITLITAKDKTKIQTGKSNTACYWGQTGERTQFGHFAIEFGNIDKNNYLTFQDMKILNEQERAELFMTHCIFQGWEEGDKLISKEQFYKLILTINDLQARTPNAPIIIQCRDCVGKSGLLMTFYNIIQDATSKGTIDLFCGVKRLRSFRYNMIPTMDHYMTCFSLAEYYCLQK